MMSQRGYSVCALVTRLVYIVTFSTGVNGVPPSLKIGGIFSTELEERVFRYTVNYVNSNDVIGHGVTLEYTANVINGTNTIENIQYACQLAERGVAAIVGPMSSTSVKAVAPVSTALHIPLITPGATNPRLDDKVQYPFLIRMLPPDYVQSLALVDLVAYYGWRKMSILTSNTEYGVNGLVKLQSEAAKAGWKIPSVQRFSAAADPSNIDAISQLNQIRETGVRVVILHCEGRLAKKVLRQAADLALTGPGWAWVVTDGITGTREVSVQGLIGTSPASGEGLLYPEFSLGWEEMNAKEGYNWGPLDVFSTLVADAVLTVAFGLRTLYDDPRNGHVDFTDSVQCEGEAHGHVTYGRLLLQHISKVQQDGVASFIEFNSVVAPLKTVFDIVNMGQHGWTKVGEWVQQKGLLMSLPDQVRFMGGRQTVYDYVSSLVNRTLTVVTIEEPPFVRLLTDDYDRWNLKPRDIEGYCMDLLNELAANIGFTYNMYLVEDGAFGIKDPITGEWNGLIRDLVDRKADVAVAGLTISYSREKDVDFSMPFIDLGMSFIMMKPEKLPIRAFSFMDPFTPELWVYMALTMIAVGAVVSFCNKLSPNDYHGETVYALDGKLEEESYSEWKRFKRRQARAIDLMKFGHSVWFAVASVLSQGGESYPKSLSGRMTSVLWWFGILILTSTYTANLTAFLTVSRLQVTINSVEDLAAQTKISYGTLDHSAPQQFFMDSNVTVFKEMNAFMSSRHTAVVDSIEARAKVRTGTYAYITDSAVLEYIAEEEPCDLHVVGRIFGKLGYGLALQKSSPYTDEISAHILQLRENGFMERLKRKWYEELGQCSRGQKSSEETDEIEDAGGRLDYTHLLGVFYIIYGAQALSVVVFAIEWVAMCVQSVDKNNPSMPQSRIESARKHASLFRDDFIHGWLPRLPAIGSLQHVVWGKPVSAATQHPVTPVAGVTTHGKAAVENGPSTSTANDQPTRVDDVNVSTNN